MIRSGMQASLSRWLLLFDHIAVQVAQGKLASATIFGTGGRDPRCGHQVQAVGVTGDTISLLFPLERCCIGERRGEARRLSPWNRPGVRLVGR